MITDLYRVGGCWLARSGAPGKSANFIKQLTSRSLITLEGYRCLGIPVKEKPMPN